MNQQEDEEGNNLIIGGKKGFEAIHSNINSAINFASKIER